MKISKQDMTQKILKEYFDYNPLTGVVTWKKKSGQKPVVGNRAGSISRYNHRVIHFKGCVWAEHRLIWLWFYGESPKQHIDHINHDELDNRIKNLRQVSQLENNLNNSLRVDNALGITGIRILRRKNADTYCAEIRRGSVRRIKVVKTLSKAIALRKQWEIELGFHENHGLAKPS